MTSRDYDDTHVAAIVRTTGIPVAEVRAAVQRLTRAQLARWVPLVNASNRTPDTIEAITTKVTRQ